MKSILRISALALMLFAFTLQAEAQGFGYVDSQTILTELPAFKQAEANLEALQTQLEKKLQASIEQLQKDYQALQQKVDRGELSPVQQQTQVEALQTREQQLGAEQQNMVTQIQDKRQELLEPIYTQLNDAIKAVAAEKGFTFIFDKQVLLFGEESQDVSTDVKAKMEG
ncbi:MAG: OmpH family outer membrane protein [Bacteroidota bacterium]